MHMLEEQQTIENQCSEMDILFFPVMIKRERKRGKRTHSSLMRIWLQQREKEREREKRQKRKKKRRINLIFIITSSHIPTNSCVGRKIPPGDWSIVYMFIPLISLIPFWLTSFLLPWVGRLDIPRCKLGLFQSFYFN